MLEKLKKLFRKIKQRRFWWQNLFLVLIVVIAGISRFYNLSEIPHGFFCDEAAIGYNAYKLLISGKDEYGIKWPFFFRSFGDYRNPVPIYLNIPTVFLFGLSDFSVRFTAAFFGFLTVILAFFFGKKIGGFWVGFFACLFLATSPWHIHLSRVGLEYIYFPFFFLLGLYFWLLRANLKYFLLSFLFFGFGLYTYYPAWLIIPLFLLGLFILSIKEIIAQTNKFIAGGFFFLFLMTPLFYGMISGKALTRWNQVQVQKASFSEKKELFIKTYLGHFSKEFLLTKGDIDYPGHFITRHSVRGFGEIYKFTFPLVILGIILIFWKRKDLAFIFYLLLLYPLGSTLTDSGPFATRSILGVIPFTLLPAIAAGLILNKISQKKQVVIIIFIVAVSLFSWLRFEKSYTVEYPLYSSDYWGWQYGPKEIIPYFTDNQEKYDEMYLEGQFNAPMIFIPFFSKDKCTKCFGGSWDKLNLSKKQLFAIIPSTLEEFKRKNSDISFKQKKKIYYPDKSVAFVIIEPVIDKLLKGKEDLKK